MFASAGVALLGLACLCACELDPCDDYEEDTHMRSKVISKPGPPVTSMPGAAYPPTSMPGASRPITERPPRAPVARPVPNIPTRAPRPRMPKE
jgi:hypothetical protein